MAEKYVSPAYQERLDDLAALLVLGRVGLAETFTAVELAAVNEQLSLELPDDAA